MSVSRRIRSIGAVIAGTLVVLILGGVSSTVAGELWPGGHFAKTTLMAKWYQWPLVLALTQFLSGAVGGVVTLAIYKESPLRSAIWVLCCVLLVLSIPIIWSLDRPFEVGWLVFLNAITGVGVLGGAYLELRRE